MPLNQFGIEGEWICPACGQVLDVDPLQLCRCGLRMSLQRLQLPPYAHFVASQFALAYSSRAAAAFEARQLALLQAASVHRPVT